MSSGLGKKQLQTWAGGFQGCLIHCKTFFSEEGDELRVLSVGELAR